MAGTSRVFGAFGTPFIVGSYFSIPLTGGTGLLHPICGAASRWLRRGKLAFQRFYRTRAFSHFPGFLSVLSDLSGEKHRLYRNRTLSQIPDSKNLKASTQRAAGGAALQAPSQGAAV